MTIYRALFKHDSKNPKSRQLLKEALELWVQSEADLRAFTGLHSTHSLSDKLAPYYYYSSVPHASHALNDLWATSHDEKEKARLLELAEKIESGIRKLGTDAQGFMPMGGYDHEKSVMYQSSPAYSFPLLAEALVALETFHRRAR